jgi:glucosamine kinase
MEDEPLFVGVDGGGTRCRARIANATGERLGEATTGAANTRLGLDAVFREIVAACRGALADAGLPVDALGRLQAGLGLAGLNLESERAKVAAHPHPFASVVAASDAYAACLGAHGGADGGILIVGTGSCGCGIVGERSFHIGGWGFQVGDQGSGAIIGRAAVRQALLAFEGVIRGTPFSAAVMARFEHLAAPAAPQPGRVPEQVVIWGDRATPGDYAALAPLVFEHAAQDDPLARTIVQRAAADVAAWIHALVRSGAPKVALVGGLAAAIVPWLPPDARAVLVPPQGDALDGALLMARRAHAASTA